MDDLRSDLAGAAIGTMTGGAVLVVRLLALCNRLAVACKRIGRAGWSPAALRLVWCIGRVLYALGYIKEANKRGPGFAIASLASLALLVLSIWGVVVSWMAANAV